MDKYFRLWRAESWLENLDTFVSTLSEENISVLREKFNHDKSHQQKNDIIHEVMVACVYHPSADFVSEQADKKTPDLFDKSLNLKIEIKSLNESKDEQDRHGNQEPNKGEVYISKALSAFEVEEKKKIIASFFETKKCKDLLDKAASQLEGVGKIYLIYNYDFLSRDNTGSLHSPILSGNEVEKIIENCCNNFLTTHPSIIIEAIYFGDLRKSVHVANSKP